VTLPEGRRMLQTAFALEAVVDEAVFMVGPTVVTLLSTALAPESGLVAAGLAGVLGSVALVAQRRTEPPPGGRSAATGGGPMQWRVLAPLTVAMICLGMLFGGAEVATVAFSQELGTKAASGPLLAVWALGSLLSGVITGSLHVTRSPATRLRWGLLVLGLLMSPLPLVHGFGLMAVMLFLAGFAISPTLIASVSWVEETVPPGRLNEALALVSTGVGAGVAPGAAIVGVVVDHAGASASYLLPAAAGLTGALVAFATSRRPLSRPAPAAGVPPDSSPSGSTG
jgi:predicted MFS family arabinose efflux permease